MTTGLSLALDLCKKTRELCSPISVEHETSLLINRQQCTLLSKKLLETQEILETVQQKLTHEEILSSEFPAACRVTQGLVHVLKTAHKIVVQDSVCNGKWMESALRQGGDLKEAFGEIMYDLQWYTILLRTVILKWAVRNSWTPASWYGWVLRRIFLKWPFRDALTAPGSCLLRSLLRPEDCDRKLSETDKDNLSTPARKDEEHLKLLLRDLMGEHACHRKTCTGKVTSMQCLATKLLKKLEFQPKFQAWSATRKKEYHENLRTIKSKRLRKWRLVLLVNPQDVRYTRDGGKLGEGHWGTVCKAEWLGESYAIKIPRLGGYNEILKQEIAVIAGLHHPHVMCLVCCSEDKKKCFYTMERMDMPLSQMLRGVQLSIIQRVDLMLQIAEGMNYLHRMHLVHRDLKTDNILIKRDDAGSGSSTLDQVVEPLWIAKVSDFGTMKVMDNTTNQIPTHPYGTPMFMAPEMYEELLERSPAREGDMLLDRSNPQKADMYSFGLICFSILIGKPLPFPPKELYNPSFEVFKARVREGMRPQLPPGCPDQLSILIRQCCDGNPVKRPDFHSICRELRYIKGLLLTGIIISPLPVVHPNADGCPPGSFPTQTRDHDSDGGEEENGLFPSNDVTRPSTSEGGSSFKGTGDWEKLGFEQLANRLSFALDLCKATRQIWIEESETHGFINRQQCKLLCDKLFETQKILETVQKKVSDEEITSSANLALETLELVHVLEMAHRTVLKDSSCNGKWMESALRQGGDLEESFGEILYDLQWHGLVLNNILSRSVKGASQTTPSFFDCDGKLSDSDALLTAAKQDQEDLKLLLRDLKGDHACDGKNCTRKDTSMQCLASQLLNKLEFQPKFQALPKAAKMKLLVTPTDEIDLRESPLVLSVQMQDLHRGPFLGGGSFANVFETNWLGEPYAMKTSRYGYYDDHLKREIATLAGLHHPHITCLVCYAEEGNNCLYLMERMDESLSRILEDNHLSLIRRVGIMLQIAEGMKYLHSMGIVHRDLTPDNIFVKYDIPGPESSMLSLVAEPFWITKVSGFGSATPKAEIVPYPNQTMNNGTTLYMAPEVHSLAFFEEMPPEIFYTQKPDVYSFGLVCFSVLTGKSMPIPHEEFRLLRDFKDRVRKGWRPQLPEDCPERLSILIQQCWDGDPVKRPNFQDICTELRSIKGLLLTGSVADALKRRGDGQQDSSEEQSTSSEDDDWPRPEINMVDYSM